MWRKIMEYRPELCRCVQWMDLCMGEVCVQIVEGVGLVPWRDELLFNPILSETTRDIHWNLCLQYLLDKPQLNRVVFQELLMREDRRDLERLQGFQLVV